MADSGRQAEELLQHWEPMVRACRRILGSREDAEDCAAAAVLQLLEDPREDLRSTEAFLVTLAKRRAVDELRRASRVRRRDVRLASGWDEHTHDIADDVVDTAEARWLRTVAQEQLPRATFELLTLLSDGRDLRSAAAELGITVRAAESQLHRARRALRGVWLKTAAAAVAFAGLGRRNLVAGAPAAGLALVAVLGAAEWQSVAPAPGSAPGGQVLELTTPAGEMRAPAASPRAVQARPDRPVQPSARPAGPRERGGAYEQVVVAVPGPAGSGVAVSEGDTGGGEQGPVEVLEACVEQLQLTPGHVGCGGRTG